MIPQKNVKNNKSNIIGRKTEDKIALKLSMRKTSGSGAKTMKGDMQNSEYVIESKATTKGSISIKYNWLVKLVKDTPIGKIPVLYISFVDEEGNPKYRGEWGCVCLDFIKDE